MNLMNLLFSPPRTAKDLARTQLADAERGELIAAEWAEFYQAKAREYDWTRQMLGLRADRLRGYLGHLPGSNGTQAEGNPLHPEYRAFVQDTER